MKESKPHILIVSSWYPSKDRPTYGSFVEEQALLLKRKGHPVTVLQAELSGTFIHSLGEPGRNVKSETYNDLTVIRVKTTPVLPKARRLSYIKLCSTALGAIQKVLKDNMPELIHSHSIFMGGIVGEYLAQNLCCPLIHTEHTSGLIFSPEDYTNSDRKLIRQMYDAANSVIFVSQYAKNEILARYAFTNPSAVVIPNVIHSMFFEKPQRTPPELFSLVAIGNLIPRKNFDLLLQAIALAKKDLPEITVSLCGEGQLKAELEERIDSLGLRLNVTFKPKLSREEVKKELETHHIHVSASQLETFGLTVAESLACGTPVVVTDSGGVRDIVTDKDGYISDQSAESLAASILMAYKNYASFDSLDIQKRARERFHEDVIYDQLEEIYNSVTR